jgi:hypothetical protein
MNEVTRILDAIGQGDPLAAGQLLPLVYGELRKLAAQRLAWEKPGQTLQPTALVHEAYLRLVGKGDGPHWEGRSHFFAAAAEAMRRILVEKARSKQSCKHRWGPDAVPVSVRYGSLRRLRGCAVPAGAGCREWDPQVSVPMCYLDGHRRPPSRLGVDPRPSASDQLSYFCHRLLNGRVERTRAGDMPGEGSRARRQDETPSRAAAGRRAVTAYSLPVRDGRAVAVGIARLLAQRSRPREGGAESG